MTGTVHTGSVAGDSHWRASGSPHWIEGEVRISGSLYLEAGTLICARPASTLTADRLQLEGTIDAPIRLLAADSLAGWGGLRTAGDFSYYQRPASIIRHTRIEHAQIGFTTWDPAAVQNVVVHRARGTGMFIGRGTLTDVRVDHACSDAVPGCSAVHLGSYGGVTLSRVTVESSGGIGIATNRRSHHTFAHVRILNSAGVGLDLNAFDDGDYGGHTFESLRITGGAAHPASMNLAMAQRLLAQAGAADSLTGNADDVIAVWASLTGNLELRVDARLAWRLWFSGSVTPELELEMEPGSRLELGGGTLHIRARAIGTADRPVEIVSSALLVFDGASPDTSVMRHARLANARIRASGGHVLHIDDVDATNTAVELRSAGSTLRNARFHGMPQLPPAGGFDPVHAAVLLLGGSTSTRSISVDASPGTGIVIDGDNAAIDGCTVTNSAKDGIHVVAGAGIVIGQCNITGNGDAGLRNSGAAAVDARHNWWGSAAGPGAPGSDAIVGEVLYQPFRTTPADHGLPIDG